MELSKKEEAALAGEDGEAMQTAYRILVATGEATDAERLVPIEWAHLSGVNYNTIGDAGQRFLAEISRTARVRTRTTLNPMGFDPDSVSRYGLDDEFISKQESIAGSYRAMGVTPSFSCIPYDIYAMPEYGTQVAFAESNAAIHANSYDGLKTNKESSFSALASAITGKSPHSGIRGEEEPGVAVRMRVKEPDELTYGMLGYFAGKVAGTSVRVQGLGEMDRRQCKAMCGGMGTSGTCAKFHFGDGPGERVDFGDEEARQVRDELDTADGGDLVVLGSPQLGREEIADLAARLSGRKMSKRCMIFCPRAVKEQAAADCARLESVGCEVLADCCACLTPLIDPGETDSVITNSIKGAFYLKNSTGVGVDLKPLSEIIGEHSV